MERNPLVGLERSESIVVDETRVVTFMGDALRVYSTPSMVSDIEYAALRLLAGHLAEGESSVGVHIALDHLAPTPLGETVEVRVVLRSVEGRRVSFDAMVRDAVTMVGRGHHVRSIVHLDSHARRLAERAARSGS